MLKSQEILRSKLYAVRNALDKANIPWLVFAGAAAYCYGSTRDITDIDILVKHEDLARAKSTLKSMDTEAFDIVGGSDFDLDDEMIQRTEHRKLFGVTIPVIPVEDNIILKAFLQRGEDQGKHDVEDIRSMIMNENLDLEYLKSRIQRWNIGNQVLPLLKSLIPNLS